MRRAAIIGFVIGAAGPMLWGIYWMYLEHSYRASFANDPNAGFCGMGMLGAWLLILVGGPFFGVFGSSIGLSGFLIYRLSSGADSD